MLARHYHIGYSCSDPVDYSYYTGVSTSFLAAILDFARSIRRKSAEAFDCDVNEILWSECLKMAWAMRDRITPLNSWAVLAEDVCEAAACATNLTSWERSFISDMRKRLAQYQEKIVISPKQFAVLEKIGRNLFPVKN